LENVEQAEHGCDFTFLKPAMKSRTPTR
jgi:hypothetical protein